MAESEKINELGERLCEIGFSDRAVSMIVEQVETIWHEPEHTYHTGEGQPQGLSEAAAGFGETAPMTRPRIVPPREPQPEPQLQPFDRMLLAVTASIVAIVGLLLAWPLISRPEPPEVAIMTGAEPSGGLALVSLILLLAAWVTTPPLLSILPLPGMPLDGWLRNRSAQIVWLAVAFLLTVLLFLAV